MKIRKIKNVFYFYFNKYYIIYFLKGIVFNNFENKIVFIIFKIDEFDGYLFCR